MKKIILTNSKEKTEETFETFQDVFQGLSEKGYVISSVEDGVIKATKEKVETEFTFGEIVIATANTKANFVAEVSGYRDGLRTWAINMKKQGLITDEVLNKLAEQLKFLKTEEKK